MVLEQLNYENSQNLKSSCNSTSNFKLIKNRHISSPNAFETRSSVNHSGNKEKGCPINTSSLNSTNATPLLIYHQNIRGLQNKIDELLMLWSANFPHIICFTEHHLGKDEINCFDINSYYLGANYCWVNHKHGGACIFVHET
jgi:hypothetical protein